MKINKITNKISNIIKYIYRKPKHLLIHLFSCLAKKIDIDRMNKIIVISPHPDDEVFGCALLINKLTERGKEIYLAILSKGEYVFNGTDAEEVVKQRSILTRKAAKVLGVHPSHIRTFSFPDGNFAKVDDSEVSKLHQYINEINPDTLFYPHPFDGSPDHCVTSNILNKMKFNRNIERYYYCVWLWHHMPFYKVFLLDYKKAFLLKGNILKKLSAIDIYVNAKSPKGFCYSGNLPKMFIKAVSWKKEFYFKAS